MEGNINTGTLTDALRSLTVRDYDWKFCFYSVQKGKDGVELLWNRCEMRGIADWAETLRGVFLEKTLADKTVAEYTPFLSDKEFVAAIKSDSEVIREQITSIITSIERAVTYPAKDFISGALPRIAGYGVFGEPVQDRQEPGQDAEQAKEHSPVLFMRRGNPFVTGQRVRICSEDCGEIITSDRPVLKFTSAVDFLLADNVCYINSSGIEKDLELENRQMIIADTRLKLIAEAGAVSDMDALEAVALTSKHARKFMDFDKEILEYILRLGVAEREEFLAVYGITLDREGRMDTAVIDQCELIIDLLCCRSVVDALGRLSTGSNITPRQ